MGGFSVCGRFCTEFWEPKTCCLARAAVRESRRTCQQMRGSAVSPLHQTDCEDGEPEHLVTASWGCLCEFYHGSGEAE